MHLVLTVADFSTESGSLNIRYDRTLGILKGADGTLFGNASMTYTPYQGPQVTGMRAQGTQTIGISFDRSLAVSGLNVAAFSVVDDVAVGGNSYTVMAAAFGTNPSDIVLTVSDFSTAPVKLRVSYDATVGSLTDLSNISVRSFSGTFSPGTVEKANAIKAAISALPTTIALTDETTVMAARSLVPGHSS